MSISPGTTHAPSRSMHRRRTRPSPAATTRPPRTPIDSRTAPSSRPESRPPRSSVPDIRPTRSMMRTTPASPSTSIRSPVWMIVVAKPVPHTAGIRYSRDTIAVWDSAPPVSQTQPAICENAGVQLGVVKTQTRISPGSTSPRKSDEVITRARPRDHARRRRDAGELGCGEIRRADGVEQALVDAEDLLHDRVVGLGSWVCRAHGASPLASAALAS